MALAFIDLAYHRPAIPRSTPDMKDHLLVTVSDLSGARFFTVKKSIRQRVAWTLLLTLGLIAASVGYNYHQRQQIETLASKNRYLEHESGRLSKRNAMLNQEIAVQADLAEVIGQELDEIERIIGRHDGPWSADAPDDLAARAEKAVFSARQAGVLHGNIPNGFPTASEVITSQFGNRIHPVTQLKSFHNGVDIRAKKSTHVQATADGIVRTANDTKMSGKRVIVRHNFGFESYYAHLSKLLVKPGDVVEKDQLIGLSGNSGQSSGPHLHYEIRYLGNPVDPAEFLRWEIGSHEIFTQVEEVQWPSLIKLIKKQIIHPTLQLSQLAPVSPATLK